MNNTIRRLLGVVLIALGTTPGALGQQIPPVVEGDPIVRTTIADNRLRMVDVANGNSIILPGGLMFEGFAAGVTGQVRLQEQPTGFDLIYTFTNTGAQPAALGRLNVGKFNLGNNIFYRDFRHVGEPVQVDYNNYAFQAFPYPHGIYAPVWTLYNDDYAVGISLQYPIMDYRHDARVMLGCTPANAPIEHGPRGWFVEYRLANIGGETPAGRLRWPGAIPAGETRTYVISVRVTKNPSEWIRTLTPYRDYFRSMYGGVQYARDARPIRPVLVAVNHLISEDNPYGFDNFQNRRPDRFGWRPRVDQIKSWSEDWSRVMLWAPTGLYDQNRNMNYPFQFTTRWQTEARMENVFDDENGLPSIGQRGMSLGLWWGRSLQVSREWNSAQWEAFDPDNPAHVQAAMAEMDLAVRAGAKEIGLDTFNARITPIWKLVPWLERMHEAYPSVKFCIEPITCDIMHRLGATFVVGWTTGRVQQESDLYDLTTPFYLADLLLPGHESWGAFSYHVHRANHYPVTPEIVQRDMEQIASLGYVPVMLDNPPSPRNIQAAESWMTTLPADVLRGSGWNMNYSAPQAHRQNDGRLVIVHSEGGPPSRPTRRNGRVGGWVPGEGAPPPNGPSASGDESQSRSLAGGDTPAPEAASAPIARPKKRINGSVRIQGGRHEEAAVDQQTEPAHAMADDLPGAKDNISVPTNAGSKGKGGAPKSNPAWLREMIRKGYMDRSKINQAIDKLRSNGAPAEPHMVIVPTDK